MKDEGVLNCLQVVWIPQRDQSAAYDRLNTQYCIHLFTLIFTVQIVTVGV